MSASLVHGSRLEVEYSRWMKHLTNYLMHMPLDMRHCQLKGYIAQAKE
jgi:hypothetical protein